MDAEDDEIDILGDFTFDSCLAKNERSISTYQDLLQCDYSVPPQWLLDTGTTSCWYDAATHEDASLKPDVHNNHAETFSDDDLQPSTSKQTGVEWTRSERELFKKGLEIYGRDANRLAIFMGTKNVMEVQLFIETEYGINLDTPTSETPSNMTEHMTQNIGRERPPGFDYGEILTDNEIPASIEEVISMVSTAEPTVPGITRLKLKSGNNPLQKNPRSILRKNYPAYNENISRSLLKNSIKCHKSSPERKDGMLKKSPKLQGVNLYLDVVGDYQTSVKTSKKNVQIVDMRSDALKSSDYMNDDKIKKLQSSPVGDKNRRRQKSNDFDAIRLESANKKSKFNISLTFKKSDGLSRTGLGAKRKQRSPSTSKRKNSKSGTDKSPTPKSQSTMQIVTGSGQALPLSEGEQVMILEKRAESEVDSDIEIDVDSDGGDNAAHGTPPQLKIAVPKFVKTETSPILQEYPNNNLTSEDNTNTLNIRELSDLVKSEECNMKPPEIPKEIKGVMTSLENPREEFVVKADEISDLEKFLYPDFFEGRPAKTPERYLMIRSHLINSWRQCRPYYLTKTAARQGLRNCGDVNCIGRIHTLMEQIGAINFNCEKTSYVRPLSLLLSRVMPATPTPAQTSTIKVKQAEDVFKFDVSRQRKKKIVLDGDGGYTITHSEFGEICEAISEPRQQRPLKKKPVTLMYCRSFSEDHPAPHRVHISLSALILMDFHSHTSRAEVMGLLGGHHLAEEAGQLVSIERYVPCDSLENSGTHCDMCPVSQSAASEILACEGLETVGWHHSHPLFPPHPSAQDILSQADLQSAFAPRPFLAVILSPHWPPGRTASQYRCMYVKKDTSSEQGVAFRFKTHLHCDIKSHMDVKMLLSHIERIWGQNKISSGSFVVDMKNDVCSDAMISYLDKCLSSIRYHLNSIETRINPIHFRDVIEGIKKIVR